MELPKANNNINNNRILGWIGSLDCKINKMRQWSNVVGQQNSARTTNYLMTIQKTSYDNKVEQHWWAMTIGQDEWSDWLHFVRYVTYHAAAMRTLEAKSLNMDLPLQLATTSLLSEPIILLAASRGRIYNVFHPRGRNSFCMGYLARGEISFRDFTYIVVWCQLTHITTPVIMSAYHMKTYYNLQLPIYSRRKRSMWKSLRQLQWPRDMICS